MNTYRELNHRKYLLENIWIKLFFLVLLLLLMSIIIGYQLEEKIIPAQRLNPRPLKTIKLPLPYHLSKISVEEALNKTVFDVNFKDDSLSLNEVSQLLWSATGKTSPGTGRTIPSLNEAYPLEIYLINGKIKGLGNGVFHYLPAENALEQIAEGDQLTRLYAEAILPSTIKKGSAIFAITGWYNMATRKYGDRGIRYIHMEAGHAVQNLFLQSVSLNIGLIKVNTFRDSGISHLLNLTENEVPLCIIPIGRKWK